MHFLQDIFGNAAREKVGNSHIDQKPSSLDSRCLANNDIQPVLRHDLTGQGQEHHPYKDKDAGL
ncbi:hypothetical protein D3C84_1210250 [compost metagenome]